MEKNFGSFKPKSAQGFLKYVKGERGLVVEGERGLVVEGERGLVVECSTAVAMVADSNPTSDTCPAADPAAV